jgi:hypothetical protein
MQDAAPFFCELAERLAELNLLDVFGVVRRNICNIPIADDELLVERTDEANRLLTLKPEHRSELNIDELTETSWSFTPVEDIPDLNVTAVCKGTHCTGHCISHCKGHCQGHCIDHGGHPS